MNADGKPEGEEEKKGGMYDWTRRRGYPRLDDLDAVLITGSRAWVFLGLCFSFERGSGGRLWFAKTLCKSILD